MRRHPVPSRAGLVLAPLLVAAVAGAAARGEPAGEWIAGDFHVHTTYSRDSWDPVADDEDAEPWTLGHSVGNQFAIAASRGMHFLAITDHNDTRSVGDPGFGAGGVIGVRGYENSLSGHAQMLGAGVCYTPTGPTEGTQGCNSFPDRDVAAVINRLADALRADGGIFQINHPAESATDWPHDADWGFGYEVVPDTVEVWNIPTPWQPPLPSASSNDDAIRFWEGWLDRGYRVAATGGSDNHWVSTTAVQGVGQPTTWVYVTERSERGILEGVRAGRTTISWQPPAHQGPRLFLEADRDGDGTADAMIGDQVPAGTTVRVVPDALPPGAEIAIHLSDGSVSRTPYAGEPLSVELPAEARWVWAEAVIPIEHLPGVEQARAGCDEQLAGETTYCRNRLVRLAMTSAMFVSP